MLTIFDVFILLFLLFFYSRMPEFDMFADYILMIILTYAVFMACLNMTIRGWYIFAHRFLL